MLGVKILGMKNLSYEHICSGTGCEFYVVWDFGEGDCFSCRKIGQSYCVTEYPQDCSFKSEMQRYESESQKKDVCVHPWKDIEQTPDGIFCNKCDSKVL